MKPDVHRNIQNIRNLDDFKDTLRKKANQGRLLFYSKKIENLKSREEVAIIRIIN